MLILTIQTVFEAFECKFETFEWDLKHSNANCNTWKGIQSIRMQIRTIQKWLMQIRIIRKGFEVFECKLLPFERDSKHSNANSKHSKRIQTIRMQILSLRKGFEAFEFKF